MKSFISTIGRRGFLGLIAGGGAAALWAATDKGRGKMVKIEQFEVTRKAGTERAFTGKYANNHADGIYTCICCGTALFDSKTKFESGTGWPSFWQPIAKENVLVASDSSFGMHRN